MEQTSLENDRLKLLARVAVGFVFVVSGALKLLFENQGPGRFAKLGFPPGVALAVGAVEIIGGLLLLAGLLTRWAALALVADMVVAIARTKLPLLWSAGPEPVAAAPKIGLWAFAYQARLDVTMLLLCLALALAGAGYWSVDARRARQRSAAG